MYYEQDKKAIGRNEVVAAGEHVLRRGEDARRRQRAQFVVAMQQLKKQDDEMPSEAGESSNEQPC